MRDVPELPEAEASRRMLADALTSRVLTQVQVYPDEIVMADPPESYVADLSGRTVVDTGRKGKFFWINLDENLTLLMHLGMSGAVLDLTPNRERALNYKEAKGIRLDDGTGVPPYAKLILHTAETRIAIVDPRRLARIRWCEDPYTDEHLARLGPDALYDLPTADILFAQTRRRKTPIKALLLDQGFLAGIGNYLADEILYHAGIAPMRIASNLDQTEITKLRASIRHILDVAVKADADYERFPSEWLFHVRWGGARGPQTLEGEPIERLKIGGRTTAWVPTRQS